MKKKCLFILTLCSVLHLSLFAQWRAMNTGLPNSLSFYTMSAPTKDVVWATLIDWNTDYNVDPTTSNYLIRTGDGGATWQRSAVFPTSPAELATNVYAFDALNAFVGTVDFNSGAAYLYRTKDGGVSWTVLNEANNGISFEPFGFIDDIRFFDAQNGIVLGDPDASGRFVIFTTRDGGNKWVRNNAAPEAIGADEIGIIGGAAFIAPNTYFFTSFYPYNRLFKSEDRGLTFREINTPYRRDTTRQAGFSGINFSDDRNGIAFTNFNPLQPGGSFGTEPNALRTTDGGETWQIISGNSAAIDSKGTGTNVPGADSAYVIPHYNRGVTATTNFGQTFTLDTLAKSSMAKFLSPTDGWAAGFLLGGIQGRMFKFNGNLSPSTLRNVTVQVDMTGQTVSSNGVYFTSDFHGWQPSAVRMTAIGNNVYQARFKIPRNTTVRYKFLNGNAWGQNESVPEGCGSRNTSGSFDRTFTVEQWDMAVPAVCFSSCISCGEVRPMGAFYCESGSDQCEIFDWYGDGKVGLKTINWRTRANYSGGTEGGDDDAVLTGFWSGYTNHGGGRAILIKDKTDVVYTFDKKTSGIHEISMWLYVPKDREARLTLLADGNNINSAIEDVMLHTNRTAWNTDNSYKTYPQNKWISLKLRFDFTAKRWTVTVDGKETYATNAPNLTSLGGIELRTASPNTEYLVDDIAIRRVTTNEAFTDVQKTSNKIAFGVYPNPTNDDLTVAFELKTMGALTLTLTDVSGHILIQKQTPSVKTGTETFLMKDLPKGAYFLRLISGDETRTEKIIKY